VTALGNHGQDGFDDVQLDRLLPILKHSGDAVLPHLVPLAQQVADDYMGPLRAVLKSASAPKLKVNLSRERRGSIELADDDVSRALTDAIAISKHLVFVLRVPPLHSVLSAVARLAKGGPVLVVCPTVRMAVLGAASLRRRGCSVALVPEDWEVAASGVDVVIGARSSVWAPCPKLSAIVVIDEHDDSLKEERVPTWHARDVAIHRAALENVRCVLSSPVPSVEAIAMAHNGEAILIEPNSHGGWPRVVIADLSEVPIAGSLATSETLQLVRRHDASVLCILNTKGRARLLACKQCRSIARCANCHSALVADGDEKFNCEMCHTTYDMVCNECGRTSFLTLRSGISQLRDQFTKSAAMPVVEVDATTRQEDLGSHAGIFIGTEALLHRVARADAVVFLDFDTELLAARVTAARDALALFVRAARVVGRDGVIIVQTRHPQHQLVNALGDSHIDHTALITWETHDIEMRKMLNLPPTSVLARLSMTGSEQIGTAMESLQDVSMARQKDGSWIVRASSDDQLREKIRILVDSVQQLTADTSARRVRVDVHPVRY
jgi:primosomal protein N' (replication factor Y)